MKKRKSMKSSISRQSIRSYLRIYPSLGIDSVPCNDYEILDGNTFLDKRENKLVMHSFNYIFTPEFSHSNVVRHMNFINDAFEGKNQLLIALIDRENYHNFVNGCAEQQALIIDIMDGLIKELSEQSNQSGERCRSSHLAFSMFSCTGTTNKFIDLILGQRYQYYSKKDIDEYKNCYQKKINQMRDFLVALKIGLVHYRDCCDDTDPIIFKVTLNHYDPIADCMYHSSFHLIAGQTQTKVMTLLLKKVEISLDELQFIGEDHGGLGNYLEKIVHRSRVAFLYGFPFRRTEMQQSLSMFQYLSMMRGKFTLVTHNIINSPVNLIEKINELEFEKYIPDMNNLSVKEIHLIEKSLKKLISLVNDLKQKWKSYCHLIEEVMKMRSQFYERQKFPVSLEIKDNSVKSFMISKIYKLSEKYQMDNTIPLIQKIRIIKNQVGVCLRAMIKIKELKQAPSKSYSEFTFYFHQTIQAWVNVFKSLFQFNFIIAQFYGTLPSQAINRQKLFSPEPYYQITQKLLTDTKHSKQKEELFLRKIDSKDENISKSQNSRSFQLFRQFKNGHKSFAEIKINSEKRQDQHLSFHQERTKREQKSIGCMFPKITVIYRKKK